MANLQIYKFISDHKFPIRDRFISFRWNFNKNVNKRVLFLNNHFNILLKKNKKEQEISNIIQKYNLKIKTIEENKRKKIKKQINKKLKKLLDQQKIKSVSNNKMILDLMAKNTNFINYLNEQKNKRKIYNNKKSALSLDSDNYNMSNNNCSSAFLTEVKNITKQSKVVNVKKEKYNNLYNTIDSTNNKKKNNLYKDNYFSMRLKKSSLKKENSHKNFNSYTSRLKDENKINNYFQNRINFIFTPKTRKNHDFYRVNSDFISIYNKAKNKNKLILKKQNTSFYKK